ncbi:Fungal transcription factor, partial [Tolypocladium paradoxum]
MAPPASAGAGMKPKKTRAKHACRECNSRRVKCNVTEAQPCSNCAASGAKCEILPSRRGRYPRRSRRLQPLAATDASASLSPRHAGEAVRPPSSSIAEASLVPEDDDFSVGYRPSPQRIAPAPPPVPDNAETPSSASAAGTLFFGESNFLTL